MKKLGKIALGLTGGGAALVLAAMLSALTGLDREPYLRASYYATTQARLAESGDSPLVVQGDFEAGFGRVPLTPTIEAAEDDPASGQFRAVPLAGYGARRGRPATGRHDELYAKAVALRVAPRWGVMIGADALIIPREVAEATMVQLAEDPGLTRAQVYFSATHTHAGRFRERGLCRPLSTSRPHLVRRAARGGRTSGSGGLATGGPRAG